QVTWGVDRVVGEHEERLAGLAQPGDELVGARDDAPLVHEDAVHVGHPALDRLRFAHGRWAYWNASGPTCVSQGDGWRWGVVLAGTILTIVVIAQIAVGGARLLRQRNTA